MDELGSPVVQWLSQNTGWAVAIAVFIFSLFFEFSKIKLSPITAILHWIGSRLTGSLKNDIAEFKSETNQKIDELKRDTEQKISDLDNKTTKALNDIKENAEYNCKQTQNKLITIEENQDRQTAERIKVHVLNFSRSLRVGEPHTEEDFKNLIRENEDYEKLVSKHGWTNDVYKADYAFVFHEFQRCQRENGFLK